MKTAIDLATIKEFSDVIKKIVPKKKNGLKLYFVNSNLILLAFNKTSIKVPVPRAIPKYTWFLIKNVYEKAMRKVDRYSKKFFI